MKIQHALRGAVAALISIGFSVIVAAPAARADDLPNYEPAKTLTRSSWAYVDSSTPTTGHPGSDTDAPVGAVDDTRITRSYFTYNVVDFVGKHILEATLTGQETKANDCGFRAVEVWVTDGFGPASSWEAPPAAQFKVATAGLPATGCEVADARFDVTTALVKAAAKGWTTVTFELRVPVGKQADPRYGRKFANDPALAVRYNTRPNKPINLTTAGAACAGSSPGRYITGTSVYLTADQPDDDGYPDEKRSRWAFWPIWDPAARQEAVGGSISWLTATFDTYYGGIELQDGYTYGWQVRTEDGTDVSSWSKTCYFTVDATAPSAPTASSPDFPDPAVPAGGVGKPAGFILDGHGDSDIVAFRWGDQYDSDRLAKVAEPGGTVTVKFTPDRAGEQWIQVRSQDKAGNTSEPIYVIFTVKESRPDVSSSLYTPWGPNGGIGVPGDFTFTAAEPGAVRFLYQLNDDPSGSVAAATDGPTTVRITPQRGGENTLRVRSKDVAGVLSSWREYTFEVNTAPTVTISGGDLIVGKEFTVDLAPGMPDVTEYEYWLSYQADAERFHVAADSAGKAQFTWVPSIETTELHVRSRNSAGAWSAEANPYTPVNWASPELTGPENGKPGETLSFTAHSVMPAVTEYVWTISGLEDGAPEHVVRAGDDGSATFDWKVPADGNYTIGVYARNATGARSGGEWKSVYVWSGPLVKSAVYPEWGTGGGVGVPGTFTVTPNMPEVVEYTYSFADNPWNPIEEKTVPAAADGSLTLEYTPKVATYNTLKIRSRSADGTLSGWKSYTFLVRG